MVHDAIDPAHSSPSTILALKMSTLKTISVLTEDGMGGTMVEEVEGQALRRGSTLLQPDMSPFGRTLSHISESKILGIRDSDTDRGRKTEALSDNGDVGVKISLPKLNIGGLTAQNGV